MSRNTTFEGTEVLRILFVLKDSGIVLSQFSKQLLIKAYPGIRKEIESLFNGEDADPLFLSMNDNPKIRPL